MAVAQLLAVFLADTARPRYGYELMQATRFQSGKLYPILRLTRSGWLVREREDVDPGQERPARYLYRLTEHGTRSARLELAELRRKTSASPLPDLRPRPASRLM